MTKRVYIIDADENRSVRLNAKVCDNETGNVIGGEEDLLNPGDLAELTISDGCHIRVDEVPATES